MRQAARGFGGVPGGFAFTQFHEGDGLEEAGARLEHAHPARRAFDRRLACGRPLFSALPQGHLRPGLSKVDPWILGVRRLQLPQVPKGHQGLLAPASGRLRVGQQQAVVQVVRKLGKQAPIAVHSLGPVLVGPMEAGLDQKPLLRRQGPRGSCGQPRLFSGLPFVSERGPGLRERAMGEGMLGLGRDRFSRTSRAPTASAPRKWASPSA